MGFESDRLHPATMRSIEAQPPAADDQKEWPSKQCGCHVRGERKRWWLCAYHEGYDDGIEAALSLPIGENTNTAAGSYGDSATPNKAGGDR